MSELQQKYQEYIDKLEARGMAVAIYACPDCKEEIKTQAAPADEYWDTLATCPHCEGMHLKITNGSKARAIRNPAS